MDVGEDGHKLALNLYHSSARLHLEIHVLWGSVFTGLRPTPVFTGTLLGVGQYVVVPIPLLYLNARPSLFSGKWPFTDPLKLMSCSC